MPIHSDDPLYETYAAKVCDDLMRSLRDLGEMETPFTREKEIIEMGRLSWAILNLLDKKVSQLQDQLKTKPYNDEDGNPDPESGKCISEMSDKLSSIAKDLGEEISSFDYNGDPLHWEYVYEVGDRVRVEPGALDGTIVKIDETPEEYSVSIKLDHNGEIIIRDVIDGLTFLSRPFQ